MSSIPLRIRTGAPLLAGSLLLGLLLAAGGCASRDASIAPDAPSAGGPSVDAPSAPIVASPRADRNPIAPDARDLPGDWDLAAGTHVRWIAELGTETYAGPTVAAGRVFVGPNNGQPRDADAADGSLLWQITHAKREPQHLVDWPLQGVCSTPAATAEAVYYVANDGVLMAVDADGFRDGTNDGVADEPRAGEADADVLWRLDMPGELGIVPHMASASAPVFFDDPDVGPTVCVNTGHGVGEDGTMAPALADRPSFLCVDARDGAIRWRDASPGADVLDGQWSAPAYGVVGGRATVVFAGGDGRVYGFAPDGRARWRFDANRHLRQAHEEKGRVLESLVAPPVIADGRVLIGIGHDPEMGPGEGKLWAIDPGAADDGAALGDDAVAWSYAADDYSRVLAPVVVADGVVYSADVNGILHALDAATGERLWIHDAFAAIWSPPLVADGRVYLADVDGDVVVLAAGRAVEERFEANLDDAIRAAPSADDRTLYVATRRQLFALAKPAG
ncbi:MAG: PQQ-binding-like beta-propeller repeat protein [Acidobacteriota bacterium]